MTDLVQAALEEWFDGSHPVFDDGDGARNHRIERLQNGVWRSYPLDDPNAKSYWDIIILARRVEE
jgi:hypothetical protein